MEEERSSLASFQRPEQLRNNEFCSSFFPCFLAKQIDKRRWEIDENVVIMWWPSLVTSSQLFPPIMLKLRLLFFQRTETCIIFTNTPTNSRQEWGRNSSCWPKEAWWAINKALRHTTLSPVSQIGPRRVSIKGQTFAKVVNKPISDRKWVPSLV